MTLFELLNGEERLILFGKVKFEIYSISSKSYLTDVLISDVKCIRDMLDLDRIPYYLLRKKVVKAVFYDDAVIRIYVK